jgi:hypothetical protein
MPAVFDYYRIPPHLRRPAVLSWVNLLLVVAWCPLALYEGLYRYPFGVHRDTFATDSLYAVNACATLGVMIIIPCLTIMALIHLFAQATVSGLARPTLVRRAFFLTIPLVILILTLLLTGLSRPIE